MPELPEVESVRRSLIEIVKNKKIKNIEVKYDKIIKSDLNDFINVLPGQSFQDVSRKGKYLIIYLDNYLLVSHLRMEGKYMLKSDEEALNKHDHVIFHLENGESLRYNDTRKFGTMYLFNRSDEKSIYNITPLNKVGPDPFEPTFTFDYLRKKISKSSKPIKTLLLDQTFISGLGNIYVDEVCFLCKIHPHTMSSHLTDDDINNIMKYSKEVLSNAINAGGTTIRTFTNSHASQGTYQNQLYVHTKKTCKNCNSDIIKIFVGGRGTYFCVKCQVEK